MSTAARAHFVLPDGPYASLDDYAARAGESAVAMARALAPADVLAAIQRAGLRGRGGSGFPVGTRWAMVRHHPCPTRYVVCDAVDGEPGSFKDRWILRQNPYAVLEGMAIAAHVVGASGLFLALRASSAVEAARVRAAARELGVAVEVIEGPEEYLYGEEKALLEVIEGNDPLPREPHNPPHEVGLFATGTSPNPAVVNNVETFARVAEIVRHGPDSFRALGTHDTPGPLVFTVSGDVRRPGVYEREAGLSLRELFYDVAGGPREGRTLKAALAGVGAGVIPAARFDTPADFAALRLIGSGLGAAGFVLYDDTASMPRVAQAVARFLYVESCNQCAACKHGLKTASEALDEIFDPRTATPDDVPRALFGVRSAPQGHRCRLPVGGAEVIPSLFARFRTEFEEQVRHADRAVAPVLVPRYVDHDPAAGAFVVDPRQAHKTPDWTYSPGTPPAPIAPPSRPAHPLGEAPGRGNARPSPSPVDVASSPVGVRLAPDVVEALADAANADGVALDALINDVLRAWAAARRGG